MLRPGAHIGDCVDISVGSRRRPTKAPTREPTPRLLDADGLMASDLWLDQPDALDRVNGRVLGGALSQEDARLLRMFAKDGFLITHIDLDAAATATLDDE